MEPSMKNGLYEENILNARVLVIKTNKDRY